MQKWEYKVIAVTLFNAETQEDYLGQLGDQGWELVMVAPQPRAALGTLTETLIYLKRPVE
jgi:hypothetical protein